MKTIWKFPLPPLEPTRVGSVGENHYSIKMPVGARILSLHPQNMMPTLWAIVDDQMPTELRHFVLYGTGNELEPKPDGSVTFIGTCLTFDGQLVWHVFEDVS